MTAHSEKPASHEGAVDLNSRMEFMKMDAGAKDRIRGLKTIIDREMPKALDLFYDQLRATPEVRRFFGDESHIARAKGAQSRHWDAISSAKFDGVFANNVRTVGLTHARIGLEPQWYIGGYAIIFEHLLKSIVAETWPKGMMSRGGARKGEEVGAALGSLAKAVFMDMDLAISIYLETLEAQRGRAEAAKRVADEAAVAAVEAIADGLKNLADKRLSYRITSDMPEAFRKLQTDFNSAIAQLQEAMQSVGKGSDAIASGSEEIAVAAQDLSHRTEQQAASLEETAAALEEVTATVGKTAEGAKHAREIVANAKANAETSSNVVREAVAAMGNIEKSSGEIGKIIGVIDEIAFQTNLLALNAGVEAARAGEFGRGFAVVAQEVRALAQRSAEAAKEIKGLITTSNREVAVGVKLVAETGEKLGQIAKRIAEIDAVVGDIAASSREQATALQEVNIAVNEMDQVTQQNAAMAEQATAASTSLSRETVGLSALIDQFEIVRQGEVAALRKLVSRAQAPASASGKASPRAAPRKVAKGGRGDDSWSEF